MRRTCWSADALRGNLARPDRPPNARPRAPPPFRGRLAHPLKSAKRIAPVRTIVSAHDFTPLVRVGETWGCRLDRVADAATVRVAPR
eukprot:1706566-Pyramimonas_sp.AAC.1